MHVIDRARSRKSLERNINRIENKKKMENIQIEIKTPWTFKQWTVLLFRRIFFEKFTEKRQIEASSLNDTNG